MKIAKKATSAGVKVFGVVGAAVAPIEDENVLMGLPIYVA